MRSVVAVVALVLVPSVARADDAAPAALPLDLYARLPVTAGPVPGATAILIKSKPSNKHCGGIALTAKIKVTRSAPAPDPELATVFKLKFPRGLDFDPKKDDRRRASMKKFTAWYETLDKVTKTAAERYRQIIGDATRAGPDRLAAAARLVVTSRWAAQVLARSELPANIRKYPEAVDVYCDVVIERAEPLAAFADDAAAMCRSLATTIGAGAGWWDAACIGPSTP